MRLTDDKKTILDGGKGDAVQMAMAILVELGDVFGANRLIPVSQVHINTTLYMVDSGVDLADICAAIIGKVPEFGLHLTENRRARMLIRVVDVPDIWLQKRAAYPLLGYIFGEMAGDRVAAIDGIPKRVSMECLKSFSAAAASSGKYPLISCSSFQKYPKLPRWPILRESLKRPIINYLTE